MTATRVRLLRVERCRTCKARWKTWSDGTCSLLPGDRCGKCCDNVPMDLEPVPASELAALIRTTRDKGMP